jgi:hypothetical protein
LAQIAENSELDRQGGIVARFDPIYAPKLPIETAIVQSAGNFPPLLPPPTINRPRATHLALRHRR